jgi:hypothetical protein
MKTLQSTTDLVLELAENNQIETEKYVIIEWQKKCDGFDKILQHAKTLKLKPEVWMFVPCDENGNVLSKPKGYDDYINWEVFNPKFEQYQTALSKVWFKGFEYNPAGYVFKDFDKFNDEWFFNSTIEDLIPYNLEITENFGKNL